MATMLDRMLWEEPWPARPGEICSRCEQATRWIKRYHGDGTYQKRLVCPSCELAIQRGEAS